MESLTQRMTHIPFDKFTNATDIQYENTLRLIFFPEKANPSNMDCVPKCIEEKVCQSFDISTLMSTTAHIANNVLLSYVHRRLKISIL